MTVFLASLNKAIDLFVPADMKKDIAKEKRARMFVISHLMGPFLSHPITLFLMTNDPMPYPHVPILGFSITLFWLFPLLLRIFPTQYVLLSFLSIQNLAFAILWGSYHYGGGQSPFLMWYLILPMLAFFYLGSGLKTSIGIFVQSTLSLGIFGALYLYGTAPVEHIPLSEMSYFFILSAFFAGTYIFFMASYYASVVDSQSEFLKEIERHQSTLKELTKAKDEAERANGAKSDFLAKMSHELRTPLNAVLGYSEILLEDAELDGRGEEIADLQKISAAGKHLLSMVNDILDISKIEAGKTDLYLEELDFDQLIDEIEATSRPLAAKNTNKFSVLREDNLGKLYLDGTKLRQAIYNLLSNAAKFTQNGEITLTASRICENNGDRIKISIADNGVGISEENIEKLFSSFSQANASITAKFGGTGLGLSLSRNLCRLMGGDISVVSKEGQGSVFTIELPAKADSKNGATANIDEAICAEEDLKEFKSSFAGISSNDDRIQSNGKVLVVDDDHDFLELTERLLSKEGYSAICTESPDGVLQLARTIKPKALLIDVIMPGLDGWDVLHTLKSDPTTSEIPVFMISILDERRNAKAEGADGFIEKPLNSQKLKAALDLIDNPKKRASDKRMAS